MFYIIPLVLTVIIELAAVYALGFREGRLFLAAVMASVITNPVLNFLVHYYGFNFEQIIISEAAVVIIEALIMQLFMQKNNLPYFRISFIMNAVSFLIGLYLPWEHIWQMVY